MKVHTAANGRKYVKTAKGCRFISDAKARSLGGASKRTSSKRARSKRASSKRTKSRR